MLCRREAAASAAAEDTVAGAAPVAASAAEVDPEQPRLTLRLPPIVLALPLLALASLGVVRTEPWQTLTPGAGAEHAETAATGDDAAEADEADEALGDTDDRPGAAAGDAEQTQPPEEPLAGPAPEHEPAAQSQSERADDSRERAPQAERGELDPLELERARAEVEVVVYYAQWCGYCTRARAYLAQRGIRSVEHDVESDSGARGRHRRLNPRGSVPTLEIDGQVLVGFDARSIERAIERAARARLSRERG